MAYHETGRLAQAISSVQEAVRIKPDFAEAWNNLGNGFAEQGQVDQAERCYREAVRIRPDYAAARHNLEILRR